MLINKLSKKRRHMLENELDATYAGQWVGFYMGEEDPTFVLQYTRDFTPLCMHLQYLVMPLPIQCFMVVTHSRCLDEWDKPTREMDGLFHEVKTRHTEGKTRKRKKTKSHFSMVKRPLLAAIQTCGTWVEGCHFLNYTMKELRDFITKRTEGVNNAADKWQGFLPRN